MKDYDNAIEIESMIFDMSTGLLTYTSLRGNNLSLIVEEHLREEVSQALRYYTSGTSLHRDILNSMFLRLYI